ncbi:phosphoglycerate kinase [Candidatus Saccharibacteria bacterium]|nr:phosphoglycerate kinase [Candidatus Saccharibacteria bacterium]
MNLRSIKNADIKDKTVLVRVDYNVPIENGEVTSDLRIAASLPTLRFLLDAGARKIVLISHLGRPEGKPSKEFSLAPVVEVLKSILPGPAIGFYALEKGQKLSDLSKNKIDLLENLRFDPREEENSAEFAQEIVNFVKPDLFVQDGFAVVHRAHASTDAITKLLPSYAGLLVEKEVSGLDKAMTNPEKPLLLIIGGSKVDDKAPLIEKFLPVADHIVVGGKIAADGYEAKSDKIYVADEFDEDATGAKLDVGPVATAKIADFITDAKTIVWNGLMGKAEDPAYAACSTIVAELLGEKEDAETIVCGGDTTGFVEELMLDHPSLKYSLISTGGGAALEYLSGKELPGLKALE